MSLKAEEILNLLDNLSRTTGASKTVLFIKDHVWSLYQRISMLEAAIQDLIQIPSGSFYSERSGFIGRLYNAVADRHQSGRRSEEVLVRKDDLRELLHHFIRLDIEARMEHRSYQVKIDPNELQEYIKETTNEHITFNIRAGKNNN